MKNSVTAGMPVLKSIPPLAIEIQILFARRSFAFRTFLFWSFFFWFLSGAAGGTVAVLWLEPGSPITTAAHIYCLVYSSFFLVLVFNFVF